jgi:ribosomal protein S18 acetylase RimI-like enzyme
VTLIYANNYERDGFTITTDLARLDLAAIHDYLKQSYWSPGIPFEIMERAIRNSLSFGLFCGDAQIGFARVVTDRATFGYLTDVYVLGPYRAQGLATWLIECVCSHPDLQGLRRFSLATRDAHALYRKFGFKEIGNPSQQMEIVRPGIYEL